ncbi:helix-turn-helix domain-containing protein [Streptomyces sp. NPDC091385]|uniref:helix-turn-helix domain-containing protein n=1 Tax=Streptomyces sp. NPDC091385 TaxID=3365997 RepID=UPI0038162888
MTAHGVERNAPGHRLVFGTQVRALRQRAGLSQEALAHTSGLHRTYVSDIERGQRNISLDNIVALAAALDVTAATLLRGI